MTNLPLVLLGLRSSARDDSSVTPAHLVYGAPLRLPGEFFSPAAYRPPSAKLSDFVQQLQHSMADFRPAQVEFHSLQRGRSDVPLALRASSSVFVRVDAVRRPLTPPYVGPYEVLQKNGKTFVLMRGGKPWTVSVDRLKPCFLPVISAPVPARPPASSPSPRSSSPSPRSSSPSSPAASTRPSSPSDRSRPSVPPAAPLPQPQLSAPTSRFGRRLRAPDRFSP